MEQRTFKYRESTLEKLKGVVVLTSISLKIPPAGVLSAMACLRQMVTSSDGLVPQIKSLADMGLVP